MNFTVAPVVEGYGDVEAVPVLLRNIAPELRIARPVRQGRGKLVSKDGLIHAVRIAATNLRECGAVLIIFDADRDCAAELSRQLTGMLAEEFPHVLCRVALVVRGFESWIVGGDPSYGVDDPDNAGDVKGQIEASHGTYRKSVDQPRHIARADLDRLRRVSRSFRHLDKVMAELIAIAESITD